MKYLKLFESYTESDIAKICQKYNIRNWSINSEGLVDVDSDVILRGLELTELPFHFGSVSGSFCCIANKLTSLEGSPKVVSDDFHCSGNQLTNLEGGPQVVGNDFGCARNILTSLKGGPQIVGGYFDCSSNQLTSLKFAPDEVDVSFVLPNPISDIPGQYLTEEYLRFIVKEQYDWNLYRKDGSIYSERLEQMIEWGIETNKIKPI